MSTLLPENELEKMRDEIRLLKRAQGIIDEPKDTHINADVSGLSTSINSLLEIFKEASEDLKMDTHDAVLVAEKLDKIMDRLERIEVQNEKIAKGVVAVADMIENLGSNKSSRSNPVPSPHQLAANLPSSVVGGQGMGGRPLPTYDVPKDDKKKSFLDGLGFGK